MNVPYTFKSYPSYIEMTLDVANCWEKVDFTNASISVTRNGTLLTLVPVVKALFNTIAATAYIVGNTVNLIASTGDFTGVSVGDKLVISNATANTQYIVTVASLNSSTSIALTIPANITVAGGTYDVILKLNPIIIDSTFLGVTPSVGQYVIEVDTTVTGAVGTPYNDVYTIYYDAGSADCAYGNIIDTLDICSGCINLANINEVVKALEAWANIKTMGFAAFDENATLYTDIAIRLDNYCNDKYCNPCN